MIDTSCLEWYMCIELKDRMTVREFNELTERIHNVNDEYSVGTSTAEDRICVIKDGDLALELYDIYDKDMPEVMRILCEYPITICEIEHTVSRERSFYKRFDAFSPSMEDVYSHTLIVTANPLLTWQAWKEESGFNKFVQEVYGDDE